MKGTIISFFEKTKKAGGNYLNVIASVDDSPVQYICTDAATMEAVKNHVGKEMDYYTFKSKDGTATFMSLPKDGGARPAYSGGSFKKADASRNESFACAYAKDIVVALIDKGVKHSDTEAAFEVWYQIFLGKLNTKPVSEQS